MLDLIIKNVQITDGSGAPSYTGDLGVRDGLIVENPSGEAREEINGTGLTVCPGFIDAHAHTDRMLGQLDELELAAPAQTFYIFRRRLGKKPFL